MFPPTNKFLSDDLSFARKPKAFAMFCCGLLSFSTAIPQTPDSQKSSASVEQESLSSDEDDRRQETIIVSGTGIKRSIDLWVTPVKVLERDDIVKRLQTTLGDTLANEPGVATTFFGAGASRPVIRGLGAERVLVLSNGLGLIDASVTSTDHQVIADGIDAERIEVLRGPSALAYGGQAIGGGVNVMDSLVSREKPTSSWTGDVFAAYNSVSGGNDSSLSVKNTPEDMPLVFSLVASMRDHNDYSISGEAESKYLHADEPDDDDDHENTGKAENTYVSVNSLAGGFSWIGDKGFLGFGVRSYSTKYGLPGHGHHEEEEEEEEEEHHESPFVDLEQTKLELHGEWSFERRFLSKISGSASFADYEHIEFEEVGEAGTSFQNEGFEVSVKGNHDLDIALVTGLQISEKTIAAFGEEAFLTSTDSSLFGLFVHAASKNHLGIGWEAGLRSESSSFKNKVYGNRKFNLLSSSAGVNFQNEFGLTLGAQLSLTERAANESELFARGPHLATQQYEVGDSKLSEERGVSLEASLRWSRNRVSFGLNTFAYNFNNFIYLQPGQVRVNNQLQTTVDDLKVYVYKQDDAEFRGGEVFMIWDVTQNGLLGAAWQIQLDLDFVDAKFENGSNVPLVPPTTAFLQVKSHGNQWALEGNLTIASDKSVIANRQLKTDGYTSLGLYGELELAALGYKYSDGVRGFIEIRNVTDEEIRYSTSVLKDRLPAPGTNFRTGVRWSF